MKYGFYLLLTLALFISAYHLAQHKMQQPLNLRFLKLGMSVAEINQHFGTPSAKSRNQLIYVLKDSSELTITLRDKKVSSAKVRFHRQLKIQDPEMKQLTLVQMDTRDGEEKRPGWFFAGKPEQGLIYKITAEGGIESLTWVPPFSYGNNRPKHLQALLRDFNIQRSM
jgi:hypothetical protein